MDLHILGAEGGELFGYKPASFLFQEDLLIDAGSICSTLRLDALLQIEHVFLSHTHLDHIKDLGLLADLLTGLHSKPLKIYGTADVLKTLREHYFNNKIWPDFTQIPPPPMMPVLELVELEPMVAVHLPGDRSILPIPVHHTVPTCAFLVMWPGHSFLYSADTGPTDLLWQVANQRDDLRGLILDVAFPVRMQMIANLAKHLTPQTAKEELRKLKRDIPIYYFHLKPAFYQEMVDEMAQILPGMGTILRSGQELWLGSGPA